MWNLSAKLDGKGYIRSHEDRAVGLGEQTNVYFAVARRSIFIALADLRTRFYARHGILHGPCRSYILPSFYFSILRTLILSFFHPPTHGGCIKYHVHYFVSCSDSRSKNESQRVHKFVFLCTCIVLLYTSRESNKHLHSSARAG